MLLLIRYVNFEVGPETFHNDDLAAIFQVARSILFLPQGNKIYRLKSCFVQCTFVDKRYTKKYMYKLVEAG